MANYKSRGGWSQLYDSTSMDTGVAGFPEKEELMILIEGEAMTSGANLLMVFNGDTGNNYTNTYQVASAGEVDAVSTAIVILSVGKTNQKHCHFVIHIKNKGAEKLYYSSGQLVETAGAGVVPIHTVANGKWVNAAFITDIAIAGITTGTLTILGR